MIVTTCGKIPLMVWRVFVGNFLNLFFFSSRPLESDLEKLTSLVHPQLSVVTRDLLDRSFSGIEMQEALFQMHLNKFPDRDGFWPLFIQSYLDLVGKLITNLCLRVLNEDLDTACVNQMLLTLIPKINYPTCVSQLTD